MELKTTSEFEKVKIKEVLDRRTEWLIADKYMKEEIKERNKKRLDEVNLMIIGSQNDWLSRECEIEWY